MIELSALRADFLDKINWIYMIYLLFSYPDHPVYPVKKIAELLRKEVISGGDLWDLFRNGF